MMNLIGKLASVIWLIGWVELFFCATAIRGQEPLLTERPDQLRAYGRVCDEKGDGIPNAKIMFAVPRQSALRYQDDSTVEISTRATTTDEGGAFEIIIEPDDPLILYSAHYAKQLLLVQASGYRVQIIELELDRLMVDLPFEIQTSRCTDLQLRVLDVTGEPIANANVKPAFFSGKRVPRKVSWYEDLKTDDRGTVVLPSLELPLLESIYVESPSLGGQLARVLPENDQAIARLAETGLVTGKLVLPDGSAARDLAGTKLLLLTSDVDFRKPTGQSWQSVVVDKDGQFTANHLTAGVLLIQAFIDPELPYTFPFQQFPQLKQDETGNLSLEISLKASPVQTEKLFILDESGTPLPRIQVVLSNNLQPDVKLTTNDGLFLVRWPVGESLIGSILPFDPLGIHKAFDRVGLMLDRLETKPGEPKSVRLTRAQALRGVVEDNRGNRLSGATITYSFPAERFREEYKTYSDRFGKFELRSLSPARAVEIKASLGSLGTAADNLTTVPAGSPAEIKLVLVPQVMASPIGQVVDHLGQPVSGARVLLRKGIIFREEGTGGEMILNDEELIAGDSGVSTDEQGRFQYPAISDFASRIKIKIEKAGYLPRETPFFDGARRTVANQQLDLGTVSIFPEPSIVKTEAQVVDSTTGEPVSDVELVFVGILTGRTVGVTDSNGRVALDLANAPQVVAAKSSTHEILFQFLDRIDEDLILRLEPKPANAVDQQHPWFSKDAMTYLAASQQLMNQLEPPSATESTFFRQSLYFQALAGLDFDQFQNLLNHEFSRNQYRNSLLLWNMEALLKLNLPKAVELGLNSNLTTDQVLRISAGAAEQEPNEDRKDELYGEAVLVLGKLSGQDRLVSSSQLARSLLMHDRVDAAEAIMRDTWETSDELKKILANETEILMAVESRFFSPMLAILNLQDSIKLIRLTAREPEKEGLLSQALMYHSMANDQPLAQLCRDHNIEFTEQDIGIMGMQVGRVPRLARWIPGNLDAIPTSATKIRLALLAARHLPPGPQRESLLQLAARLRADLVVTNHHSDPAKFATLELLQFTTMQVGELDEFTYACFRYAPDSFLNSQMLDSIGSYAKLLSFHDPQAARKFLQSAIDVEAWHGGVEYPSRFSYNELLKSAAWIDPLFAVEVAEKLAQRWGPENPTHQLGLYSDMIQALNEVRLAIEQNY